jgi:hypothetical protein
MPLYTKQTIQKNATKVEPTQVLPYQSPWLVIKPSVTVKVMIAARHFLTITIFIFLPYQVATNIHVFLTANGLQILNTSYLWTR